MSKDIERNFKEKVKVIISLYHLNVVLFIAAYVKLPIMCIVIEYMALGSMFDILYNDLLSYLPQKLTIRMAYQAARKLHFLHSSDIVYCNLKSLNLLLDSKWQVKVSDFSLTK